MQKLLTRVAVVVAVASGLIWSMGPSLTAQDSSQVWSPAPLPGGGGPVRDIDIDPADPSVLLIASDGGGLWRSTDGGTTWASTFTKAPSQGQLFRASPRIRDLQRHPTQSGVIYAATATGLLKSTDNGLTWAEQPLPTLIDGGVHRIAIAPDGATMLIAVTKRNSLAATSPGTHLYRSTDNGGTWSHTLWSGSTSDPLDMALGPNGIASAMRNRSSLEEPRAPQWSNNGGATWTSAAITCANDFGRVAIAASDANVVYQVCSSIIRSTDAGQTFTVRGASVGSSALWIDPTDPLTIVVGGTDAWLSRDGGTTGTLITDISVQRFAPAGPVHTVVSDPGFNGTSNRRVYIGTDYGLFRVDDIYNATPSSWTSLNAGLHIEVIESLAMGANQTVFAATVNRDVLRHLTGDLTFSRVATDPLQPSIPRTLRRRGLIPDRTDGSVVWLLKQPDSDMYRSDDGGSSFTLVDTGIAGLSLASGLVHPTDGNRRFIMAGDGPSESGGDLFATSNARSATPTWASLSAPIWRTHDWAIAPDAPQVLWGVGRNIFPSPSPQLARSTNGQDASPTFSTLNLATAGVDGGVTPHRLAIATTGSVAYLVGGPTSTSATPQNVYFYATTDGGTTWTRRSDVPVSVNEIVVHPTIPTWVFAATTRGLYLSRNGGGSWSLDSPSIGHFEYANVVDVAWRGTTLYAATAGRGLWYRSELKPLLSTNRTTLRFGGRRSTSPGAVGTDVTPAQDAQVSFIGGTGTWSATALEPWAIVTNGTGTGTGTFSVSIDPAYVFPVGGIHSTVVRITSPQAAGDIQVGVQLTLQTTTNVPAQPPFGRFDSPADGASGLAGAIAVTGWALDDVNVQHVEIWRNCVGIDFQNHTCASPNGSGMTHVLVGRATFLPGARPDVEAAMHFEAASYRAGWGLLVLTTGLPHVPNGTSRGGQGEFVLSAFATDSDGLVSLLGIKTITLDNDNATRPFGTIDTPHQGATIPGSTFPFNNPAAYPVFGWAMTQAGKCIDTASSSSYSVYVDGMSRTLTPGVNWFSGLTRGDLAAAYPGLCNSNNALAAYYLDVTTLSNGIHTIAWHVTDDGNNTGGIGSRFFNVLVSGADVRTSDAPVDAVGAVAATRALVPTGTRTIRARVGSDNAPWYTVTRDHTGTLAARMPTAGRIVLDLGGAVESGAQLIPNGARALPAGSTLDAAGGRFYWMPPVGFLGTFTLAFDAADGRIEVLITIADPASTDDDVSIDITSPRAGANPNPAITVAGTAIDPQAVSGSGVTAVHVWAKRLDVPDVAGARAPFFLGAAALDGRQFLLRPAPLAPGSYDIQVFAWSTRLGTWAPARVVSIAVR